MTNQEKITALVLVKHDILNHHQFYMCISLNSILGFNNHNDLIRDLWLDRQKDKLLNKGFPQHRDDNPPSSAWYMSFDSKARIANINATIKRLSETIEQTNIEKVILVKLAITGNDMSGLYKLVGGEYKDVYNALRRLVRRGNIEEALPGLGGDGKKTYFFKKW